MIINKDEKINEKKRGRGKTGRGAHIGKAYRTGFTSHQSKKFHETKKKKNMAYMHEGKEESLGSA